MINAKAFHDKFSWGRYCPGDEKRRQLGHGASLLLPSDLWFSRGYGEANFPIIRRTTKKTNGEGIWNNLGHFKRIGLFLSSFPWNSDFLDEPKKCGILNKKNRNIGFDHNADTYKKNVYMETSKAPQRTEDPWSTATE